LIVKKQIKDDARRRENKKGEKKGEEGEEGEEEEEEKQQKRKESEWPELLQYNTAEKTIDYFQSNPLVLVLAILAIIVIISIIIM
jgi:hypothetical protein